VLSTENGVTASESGVAATGVGVAATGSGVAATRLGVAATENGKGLIYGPKNIPKLQSDSLGIFVLSHPSKLKSAK